MTWIKEDLWVPDGMPDGEALRPDNLPEFYFARPRNWWIVRDLIDVENPAHVVHVRALMSPMYGWRIRNYRIYLAPNDVTRAERPQFQAWEDQLKCRVEPSVA